MFICVWRLNAVCHVCAFGALSRSRLNRPSIPYSHRIAVSTEDLKKRHNGPASYLRYVLLFTRLFLSSGACMCVCVCVWGFSSLLFFLLSRLSLSFLSFDMTIYLRPTLHLRLNRQVLAWTVLIEATAQRAGGRRRKI